MNIWKALLRVQLVLGLVIFLHGCVPLPPVPLPDKLIQEMISEERLTFLDVGRTTKEEVRATLGIPYKINEDDTEWVYELRTVESSRWAWCIIQSDPDIPDCTKYGKRAKYLLRINFNDADVITDWDKFKSKDE